MLRSAPHCGDTVGMERRRRRIPNFLESTGEPQLPQAVQRRTHGLGHGFEWAILGVTQINAKIHAAWDDVAGVRMYYQLPYGPHAVWCLRQGCLLDRLHYVRGSE